MDRIYLIEFEIRDSADTIRSDSYIDIHLGIYSECRLRTKPYDNTDGFNLPIMNFPFICSNIPAVPTYGVYPFQLIQYYRACGKYPDFLERGFLLTRKILNHVLLAVKLKSPLCGL